MGLKSFLKKSKDYDDDEDTIKEDEGIINNVFRIIKGKKDNEKD